MKCEKINSKIDPYFSFIIGGQNPYENITNNFFFHSEGFLRNQNIIVFYILNNKLSFCEGSFSLSIQDEIGYSPLKAPFGSIDISKNISPQILDEFLVVILNWCRENDLKSLKIKHYPDCYDPEGNVLVQNLLFNKGFLISNSDISQYIKVLPGSPVFNRSAKIKISKCKRADFKLKKLSSTHLEEVYYLIKNCKDKKGYPTNMSLDSLEKIINKFPERYLIFGVTDNDKLISASICVVINNNILYDFTHGHLQEYNKFSPVNFLVEGIFNYCFEKGYKILDLGLSTNNSIVNSGLFDFKSRLGTLRSAKLSYTKDLF